MNERDCSGYRLNGISKSGKDDLSVFFLDKTAENPKAALNTPFRRNFYAVGICLRGAAVLQANLETYRISPDTLITSPPHIINQWIFMSDDFETLSVLFSKDFVSENNNLNLDQFKFFESSARHAFQLSAAQSKATVESLKFLKAKPTRRTFTGTKF